MTSKFPVWSWATASLGAAFVIGAGFLEDGTYWQALAIQLGAVMLLLLPIAFAERSIAATVSNRFRDTAAISRTEQFYLAEEVVRHFGQSIGQPAPPTSSDHLGRILGAEGWKQGRVRDGHQMWSKATKTIAIPVGRESLGRAIVLGACRYASWDIVRYVELWNVTRPEGADPYVSSGPLSKQSPSSPRPGLQQAKETKPNDSP
jgi:hypothetical protein